MPPAGIFLANGNQIGINSLNCAAGRLTIPWLTEAIVAQDPLCHRSPAAGARLKKTARRAQFCTFC
jgi:hypothetical protein